jgi:hypothetical protein
VARRQTKRGRPSSGGT